MNIEKELAIIKCFEKEKTFTNEIEKLMVDADGDECCGVVFRMKNSSLLKFFCSECKLVTNSYEDFQKHLNAHWSAELIITKNIANHQDNEINVRNSLDDLNEVNSFPYRKNEFEDTEKSEFEDTEKSEFESEFEDTEKSEFESEFEVVNSYNVDNSTEEQIHAEDIKDKVEIEVLEMSEVTQIKENTNKSDAKKTKRNVTTNKLLERDSNKKKQNNDSKIYSCTKCDSFFHKSQTLRQHMKSHSNEHKHVCSYCGYGFKLSANLKLHLQRHAGQKRFSCSHCPKMFFTRSELLTHERRHTGEKPYVCSYCGSRFVSSGGLHAHSRTHSTVRPYQCQYCDKTFIGTYQLNEHMPVHTKERKFNCEICSSTFTRIKSLRAHMKLHANKREYVCNICNRAFNQRPSLTMHLRKKHNVIDTKESVKKTTDSAATSGQC